jgi:hypothetical protein
VCGTVEELFAYLDNYVPSDINTKWFDHR